MKHNLYGLILCGGKSSRMGHDKALIEYHGCAQYLYLYQLFNTLEIPAFLSCNSRQNYISPPDIPIIYDGQQYINAGPMSGLLSAFNQHPDSAYFIMGCDYPLITATAMFKLLYHRDNLHEAVCFHNPVTNYDEPVLAIYEAKCLPALLDYYKKGNTSLKHFLKIIKTKRITPDDPDTLVSIDNVDEYAIFKASGK